MFKMILEIVLLFTLGISTGFSVLPLPKNLQALSNSSGLHDFNGSANRMTLKLFSHFTTQENLTYCGVASAVMVLNAIHEDAPFDKTHATYHYFNQDNFFNDPVSKIISRNDVQTRGM